MANRITFHLILFSFLFYKEAFASEGGMPQLNPSFGSLKFSGLL